MENSDEFQNIHSSRSDRIGVDRDGLRYPPSRSCKLWVRPGKPAPGRKQCRITRAVRATEWEPGRQQRSITGAICATKREPGFQQRGIARAGSHRRL